jgi:hypothetical protein
MMFNATFNNISVISWRSVLLVEEAGVSGENQTWSASSHNFILSNQINILPTFVHTPDKNAEKKKVGQRSKFITTIIFDFTC